MEKLIKRLLDVVLAFILFIPGMLVLLVGIILVIIVSPEASAVFKQERIGYKRKHFTLFKLRSMTNECDVNGNLLPDEVRLKKWGKIIRITNIDELFQIWNILKGEMSFMRPGITGWEAIHEGESENRRQMAEFDLYYVRNWNLKLDWVIFYKTIQIILGFRRPDDSVRAPKMSDDQICSDTEKTK